MSRALKQHLFKAYNGFADKRIKNLDKGHSFIIDNRDNEPMNFAFCMIFAELAGPDRIKLIFQGNLPYNDTVKKMIESKGGTLNDRDGQVQASVGPLTLDDIAFLDKLRAAIRDVTNKPYEIKSWKYSAVRVSDSLRRFISTLKEYRDSPRKPEGFGLTS